MTNDRTTTETLCPPSGDSLSVRGAGELRLSADASLTFLRCGAVRHGVAWLGMAGHGVAWRGKVGQGGAGIRAFRFFMVRPG